MVVMIWKPCELLRFTVQSNNSLGGKDNENIALKQVWLTNSFLHTGLHIS